MKNLFEPDTLLWYAKLGIPKPVHCEYIGPVKVDFGGYSNMHIVRFCSSTLILVEAQTLYANKQEANDVFKQKKINRVQDLEMYIAMSQFELKELRGN